MAEPLNSAKPRVVIVGAGLAGISMAIALKSRMRYDNFTIYERDDGVGGTWHVTTYPGCASDVPGHWYSLSTELNPNWSRYYVTQSEIKAYWDGLFRKHHLDQHTVFKTNAVRAAWSETDRRWTLTLQDVATKQEREIQAEIVIWATGPFSKPARPDIPGLDTFKGEVWHTASWRHDVSLAGKRIAVIGNGCSAAQLVPQISEDSTTEVINFARTLQWYVPRPQYTYPQWAKFVFTYVPFAGRIYRNWLMAKLDFFGHFLFDRDNTWFIRNTTKQLTKYIKDTAPPELADKLIPNFSPGCRRVIVNPGYLESLKRPNVTLVQEPIENIEASGIKVKARDAVPVDYIVLATGYDTMSFGGDAYGRKGLGLKDYFNAKGGPTAYLGTLAPGFPNFFILTGPNTATGHASIIFTVEVQIGYSLKLLKPLLRGKIKELDVKPEACDEYNEWLERRLNNSVWTGCRSFYRTGQTGKNFATFPGAVTRFWWLNRSVNWNHFTVDPPPPPGEAAHGK